MRRSRTRATVWIGILLCAACFSGAGWAQGTGERLCSGGGKDGRPCETQADCPGGACVVASGVCDAPGRWDRCDCPGGTCSAGLACGSGSGTCVGGAQAGTCCEVTFNCAAGESCVGTQKICVGSGPNKAFACLRDDQCGVSGPCRSTGLVCREDTDYGGLSCVSDGDCCTPGTTCPRGACVAPAGVPTPTASPSPTPHPPSSSGQTFQAIGEGGGCSIQPGLGRPSVAVLAGAVLVWGIRRRRGV